MSPTASASSTIRTSGSVARLPKGNTHDTITDRVSSTGRSRSSTISANFSIASHSGIHPSSRVLPSSEDSDRCFRVPVNSGEKPEPSSNRPHLCLHVNVRCMAAGIPAIICSNVLLPLPWKPTCKCLASANIEGHVRNSHMHALGSRWNTLWRRRMNAHETSGLIFEGHVAVTACHLSASRMTRSKGCEPVSTTPR